MIDQEFLRTLPFDDETKLQSNLDALTEMFLQTWDYQTTKVYDKQGTLPESFLTTFFNHLQQRSLEGKITYQGRSLRILTLHLDQKILQEYKGKEVHHWFAQQLADFLKRVPEYQQTPEQQAVLEKLTGKDFSKVYRKTSDSEFLDGEKEKPLMEAKHNFSYNLIELIMTYYRQPGSPLFVPLLNFTWPTVKIGKEREEAIAALQSYAFKRQRKYSFEEHRVITEKKGKLTPSEEATAKEQRTLSNMIYLQAANGNNIQFLQIIATPLYFLDALPYDGEGESWSGSPMANDVTIDEVRKYVDFNLI
ncbi:MAG: hypothetical protein Q7R96_03625 [Nanoarchaeota archaeon]|nr:hypothetical protein [Nanoarchaeota archaeon]